MNRKTINGFTLVELMIVVAIIGVFAAVAVPTMLAVNEQKALKSMVVEVQGAAANVRTYALQTKQATVLEFTAGRAWINVLDDGQCWSPISQRCVINKGAIAADPNVNSINLAAREYTNSDALMCGGVMRVFGTEASSPACNTATLLNMDGFALCYSGRGELWARNVPDLAAACVPQGALLGEASWTRTCGADTALDTGSGPIFDGAVVVFNRHEGGVCTGTVKDVRRGLFFPTMGAPFSKVHP